MSEDYNQMISESTFWQAEKVAGNDDLLSEILLRLPISSLLNFSFPSVEPMHYCNGLLCLKLRLDNDEVVYCVYNPCTNQYTNIPKPDMVEKDEIVAINLAFDPLKSSDYKIICVVKDILGLFRFLKFSNESTWKELDQKVVRGDLYFGRGFDVLCFIDGEKEGKPLLMLTLPEKMISYNIKNMKIEKLVKMPLQELHLNMEGFLVYHYKWYHAYKYIETLALV
ncbi:unnamed protein product [Withania somnifera]